VKPTKNLREPKLYMNPTKNLRKPKLYMNPTKNLRKPKLLMCLGTLHYVLSLKFHIILPYKYKFWNCLIRLW
jgi:hypothetical protein